MKSRGRRRLHHKTSGWFRQRRKLFLSAGVVLLLLVTAIQLLYPRDTTLPFARLNGEAVGHQKSAVILNRLQITFLKSNVTVQTDSKNAVMKSLRELGALPNSEKMAKSLTEYSWSRRLIPFSVLFMRPHLENMDVYFSQAQLLKISGEMARELSRPPKDARLAIKKGELISTPAVDGYRVDANNIAQLLSSSRFVFATTKLSISGKRQPPRYGDADIAPVRSRAEAMINRHITLTEPSGREFVPSKTTLASWITLKTRSDYSIALTIDKLAVKRYVETINKTLDVPAGTTIIKLLDGNETSRSGGKAGRAVVTRPLIDGLIRAIDDDTAPRQLAITYSSVSPGVIYEREYSTSEAGLRAYVQYVTSSEDIHIALAQLNGGYWTANGRATESIPSASTYKLYVGMVLFDKIERGEIKWSDSMLDTDVATCVEQMFVPSLNACAEQFIARFGRSYIENYLYARGISQATTFTSEGAVRTSAADLAVTLRGLVNGTLYRGENRSILLEKMGRQIYRGGVPAGSSGSVQDKVGYLWGYIHDVAIVHTQKGSYVAVIMTNGASYARIAAITQQLERIMYP